MIKRPLIVRYRNNGVGVGLIQILSMRMEYEYSPNWIWTDEYRDRRDIYIKFIVRDLIDNKLSEISMLQYAIEDGKKSIYWDDEKIKEIMNLNHYKETFQFELTSL